MRIGIVNDLALAREVLRRIVAAMPGYTVAWAAEDGADAARKAAADRPDAILMDLVMPRVNGVEATRQIMQQAPCPILIVTNSVAANFPLVFQALGAGAVDAVDTPTVGPSGTIANQEKLVARLLKLECALNEMSGSSLIMVPLASGVPGDLPPLVLLGASTGGPQALVAVVSTLPADFPAAVLISLHIGADFALGVVQQLALSCALPVRAVNDGDHPTAGTVHVAVTDDHMELAADRCLRYTAKPRNSPFRPSVDVLFSSAAGHSPSLGVAALLTGMGNDGAAGLLRLRAAGWHTIAQDEATSVVYGMPRAAVENRAAVEVLPLPHIGASIVTKILSKRRR